MRHSQSIQQIFWQTNFTGRSCYKVMSYECSEIQAVYLLNEIVFLILFSLLTKNSNIYLQVLQIFRRSGHELIVVDIQGVGDLYTDPQIHTSHGQ